MAGVGRIRDYIAAGDVYQVNLAHRYETELEGDLPGLYLRLRRRSPAPYGAYLNFGDLHALSISPERFVSLRAGQVRTRPIKGTRPRGADAAEDARLRAELEASAKDRAELLMIVDLERNDLGRVCQPGSVRVEELYTVEAHPTVWHLVSEVSGRLAQDRDVFDLLKAAFPGGSITGAPKIRAMQIIAELEPHRRGLYCGSIGWLGFDGDAELNIAIRTLVEHRGRAYYHVGGGITWDSVPHEEYAETQAKACALREALTEPSKAVNH
jgi:para-aminobenzoate synthetase component 1